MTIKHVSFDVWNTLIKPNPAYAEARTEFLANRASLGPTVVRQMYTEVKAFADNLALHTGAGMTTRECCAVLSYRLSPLKPIDPHELATEFSELFYKYQPAIVPEAAAFIERLWPRGITTSIASNTNFIPGHILRGFLENKFGDFDFYVFSDRERVAKPDGEFFKRVWQELQDLRPPYQKQEVLHVGDHPICDAAGAGAFGFDTALILDPSDFNRLEIA